MDGVKQGSLAGSPPRMRGKELERGSNDPSTGITPAYAGKSSRHDQSTGSNQDHPRVCGEKALLCLRSLLMVGSPPRMRGKAVRNETGKSWKGITPAYAGKSLQCSWMNSSLWDHPRVCGEKLEIPSEVLYKQWITPAYAGKRPQTGSTSRFTEDHPRVCGEKCSISRHTSATSGSPPRMRGKD